MLLVLWDFTIQAVIILIRETQDVMVSVMIMGLSQVMIGSTHCMGLALDMLECSGQVI